MQKNELGEMRNIYLLDVINGQVKLEMASFSIAEDIRPRVLLPLATPALTSLANNRINMSMQNPHFELETKLRQLSERGRLQSAEFIFGVEQDPFHPYHEKFHLTLRLLKVFERFPPARLQIQTRSPLIVLALPTLKKLQSRVSVTMGLETSLETVHSRYTPELAKVRERVHAAAALGHFGVSVDIQVAPLLPYGPPQAGAKAFARLLVKYARSIYVQAFDATKLSAQANAAYLLIADALLQDGGKYWLQPHAAAPLLAALAELDPDKLNPLRPLQTAAMQTELFAA